MKVKYISKNKCRICGYDFFPKPLLRYKNMPRAAQFLPDKKSLKNDKGVDLEICQCSGCGLVQLNSVPVPYYKEVIRAVGISPEIKKFRLKQFNNFVKKFFLKGKKVIEIGCGQGEYLGILDQLGIQAFGLEYSKKNVKECIKKGLKVQKGFLEKENYKLEKAPFDGFFMLSFLEHLPDPNSTLRGIYNNLKENAVGFVEVPNFDMILRKKLFSEFITDHLLYFAKDTLTTTLKLNRFEVLECKEVWHNYIISATVRKRKKLDISYFYKHQEKIKKEIERYIRRFKKVAVWGAGHQALTIMALMNLKGKIKYVIDSAPFKQGKYTPATHISIASPDVLNSDPVDAIIVMAASYSDEVVKLIREKYNKNIKVAILRDFGLEEV